MRKNRSARALGSRPQYQGKTGLAARLGRAVVAVALAVGMAPTLAFADGLTLQPAEEESSETALVPKPTIVWQKPYEDYAGLFVGDFENHPMDTFVKSYRPTNISYTEQNSYELSGEIGPCIPNIGSDLSNLKEFLYPSAVESGEELPEIPSLETYNESQENEDDQLDYDISLVPAEGPDAEPVPDFLKVSYDKVNNFIIVEADGETSFLPGDHHWRVKLMFYKTSWLDTATHSLKDDYKDYVAYADFYVTVYGAVVQKADLPVAIAGKEYSAQITGAAYSGSAFCNNPGYYMDPKAVDPDDENVTQGDTGCTFKIAANSSLPKGLSLDPETGAITGTVDPSAETTSFVVNVEANNDETYHATGDTFENDSLLAGASFTITVVQPANTEALDAAVKTATEKLQNRSWYTDESLKKLDEALEAARAAADLTADDQKEVDKLAKDVEDATNALAKKPADYTKVNSAKGAVPADLSLYTDASVANLNKALAAVENEKTIDEQATVDGWADAITAAVAALEKKSASDAPSGQVTPGQSGASGQGSQATTQSVLKASVSAKAKTVKAAKLKKKAQQVAGAIKVKNAPKGSVVKYQRVKKGSSKALAKVNAKTGKITVKKGTKAGTYKVNVKVTVSHAGYKPFTKTITVKVKVKR